MIFLQLLLTGMSSLTVRLFCLLARLRSLYAVVLVSGMSSLYMLLFCFLAHFSFDMCGCFGWPVRLRLLYTSLLVRLRLLCEVVLLIGVSCLCILVCLRLLCGCFALWRVFVHYMQLFC